VERAHGLRNWIAQLVEAPCIVTIALCSRVLYGCVSQRELSFETFDLVQQIENDAV
jgi:hypothetical protein